MIIGKTLAVVWRDQNAYQDARPRIVGGRRLQVVRHDDARKDARPRIVGGRRHKASPALFALRDRDTVSMLR